MFIIRNRYVFNELATIAICFMNKHVIIFYIELVSNRHQHLTLVNQSTRRTDLALIQRTAYVLQVIVIFPLRIT